MPPKTAKPATCGAAPVSHSGSSPWRSEDFAAAARKFPDRADIYYNLALALEADQKPAEALRAIEQAVRLAPDFADARGLSHRLALAVKPVANSTVAIASRGE